MNTIQLIALLKRDKYTRKTFCGVIPINHLPLKKIHRKCSFIVNTDESSLPGTHWFAIYIPKTGPIEYFDSFGRQPEEKEVKYFIKINNRRVIYNSKLLQSSESITCGHFCIFYLLFRNRGYTMKMFTKFFNDNRDFNDKQISLMYLKMIKHKNLKVINL